MTAVIAHTTTLMITVSTPTAELMAPCSSADSCARRSTSEIISSRTQKAACTAIAMVKKKPITRTQLSGALNSNATTRADTTIRNALRVRATTFSSTQLQLPNVALRDSRRRACPRSSTSRK